MSWSRCYIDARTEKVIGSAVEVHRALGPGLLEGVYRECLIVDADGRAASTPPACEPA
jgi:GxxExxY protein